MASSTAGSATNGAEPLAQTGTEASGRKDELQRLLEREEGARRWLSWLGFIVLIAVLVGAGLWIRQKRMPPPPARFMTVEVKTADVSERVQATGNVQPVLQVNVGSQANGRVTKVLVDFNSSVKKGDVLAEIDGTIYGAQVSQSQASLAAQRAQVESAKANAAATKANLQRIEKLVAQNLASQTELDTARGQADVAAAQYAAAGAQVGAIQAQLSQAQTNAGFTKLVAPVDGVVISRSIDPGAMVVASFQSPTLFVIAQELKRMRIMADIDEADVGKVKEGMSVDATVDAFPGETFRGKVEQVRYSPNNVSGVVTYAAVVEVENPDEKLRPGMTATVNIKTREAKDALSVPNAALRFKPAPPMGPDGKPKPTPPEPPLAKGKGRIYVVVPGPAPRDPSDKSDKEEKKGEEETEHAEPRIVDISVSDGIRTVLTGLPAGTKVITDETDRDARGGGDGRKNRVL
jgi:HlyD family secretion protein